VYVRFGCLSVADRQPGNCGRPSYTLPFLRPEAEFWRRGSGANSPCYNLIAFPAVANTGSQVAAVQLLSSVPTVGQSDNNVPVQEAVQPPQVYYRFNW